MELTNLEAISGTLESGQHLQIVKIPPKLRGSWKGVLLRDFVANLQLIRIVELAQEVKACSSSISFSLRKSFKNKS